MVNIFLFSGKCEKCLDCGPCSTTARFWTIEDCQNDCEFPDRMRIFQQETFSVLYSEVYPGLYPFKRNLLEVAVFFFEFWENGWFQLWLSGNIRQPESTTKKNNFGASKNSSSSFNLSFFLALRGVILEARRNPSDPAEYSIMMTINEDYNQNWVAGYSARLSVTLRKKKRFPLG